MTVSVVIPWASYDPDRYRALDYVLRWWAERHPDYRVVIGEHWDDEWCKALAVRDGLKKTTGDVVIVADADVICDGISAAVAALEHHGWAIPHRKVRRLDQAATAQVYWDHVEPHDGMGLTEPPYTGRRGGGITVLTRALYEAVPLDPRFRGWGQEDESWDLALTCLAGEPWRGEADLWHLWHPPQERMNRSYGSPQSKALHWRYQRVRSNPQQMRQLVEEATWMFATS
jgi:hypothetical protein